MARHDNVEGLVQHHFASTLKGVGVNLGMQRYPHFATVGEHINAAVIVGAQYHTISRRGLGKFLDLFA